MARTNPSSERGFTLIELMMAMGILMVLLTLALPNVLGTERIRVVQKATSDVTDMVQFTRNRAVNDFRAHGIQIIPASSNGSGELRVLRGAGPACSSIDANGQPIRTYDLDDVYDTASSDGTEVTVRITGVQPQALSILCFTPDGRTVDAGTDQPVAPAAGADPAYGAGDAVIVLRRFEGEAQTGLPHNVIIPYSGKPRVTFGEDVNDPTGQGGA